MTMPAPKQGAQASASSRGQASASSRGQGPAPPPPALRRHELRIGSWNLGVPDEKSCMGKQQRAFQEHLQRNLPFVLDEHHLGVLIFQEVSFHWAQVAQQAIPGWAMAWSNKKAILVKEIGSVQVNTTICIGPYVSFWLLFHRSGFACMVVVVSCSLPRSGLGGWWRLPLMS